MKSLSAHSFPPLVRPLRAALLLVASTLLFASSAFAQQQLYTCGMHPQVIKTEPGDCPICHMKLTPLLAGSGSSAAQTGGSTAGSAAAHLATIHIDSGTIQRMNLKTQTVSKEAAEREIRTVGIAVIDERTRIDVTTRFEGWIEKLYANASWQHIKKGDPLFEIYSPALYSAQLNYLVALRSEGENGGPITAAARDRLLLLGVAEEFIDTLKTTGKAERNYTYRSPVDGVVIEKFVTQGQMIQAGQPIYSIADLSQLWIEAQVYEKDLPLVQAGQSARIRPSYGSDQSFFEAEVSEVLPQVQAATRSAIARITVDNKDELLRPGMFTDVRFAIKLSDSAVLVPDEAVLRSGEKNTVFLALDNGGFEPRQVVLGPRTNDHRYIVESGLSEGDKVVVSGQFMLDSESRLREAIQKMIAAAGEGTSTDAAGTASGGGISPHATSAAAHSAAGHSHGSHSPSHTNHKPALGDHKPARVDHKPAWGDHAHTAAATPTSTPPVADACCSGTPAQAEATAGKSQLSPQQAAARRQQMMRPPLVVLSFAAADASTALSSDDLASYRKQLPALRAALAEYLAESDQTASGPLAAFATDGTLNDPATIAAAREAFAPFSNRLTETAEAANLHRSGLIHIFECPMVPKVGTGRWLQRNDGDAYNPFFGADMLHCGGIVR